MGEETERTAKIRQMSQRVKRLKTEYGVEGPRKKTLKPVMPKKKKKGTIRSILKKIKTFLPKAPKPKTKIDLPKIAKEDIPALREIMGRPALGVKKKK